MKALEVDYVKETDTITEKEDVKPKPWSDICELYNDDVHKIRSVEDKETYTGLYECCDDNNNALYYIVEEDNELYREKRKHFLKSLGI